MAKYPESIQRLIDTLSNLPNLGPKSAERIVFHLLKQDREYIRNLSGTIQALKDQIKICSTCFNVSTGNPCDICRDRKRNRGMICVVAEPQDLLVIEKTGEYSGLYHVLGGVLNPVRDISPDKLTIGALLERVRSARPKASEVIIATNPDLEGESTAMYLARKLKELGVKTTRLARGLPMGSAIEYADEVTVSSALKGRQVM
ncbi:MAG: recombination mediator RecR [Patescibacteria group bacterium]